MDEASREEHSCEYWEAVREDMRYRLLPALRSRDAYDRSCSRRIEFHLLRHQDSLASRRSNTVPNDLHLMVARSRRTTSFDSIRVLGGFVHDLH